jgi:hypothetical protein
MARGRVLTSFVVTLGVLALLVTLSLRNAGAQAEPTSDGTTVVHYLPVAGMSNVQVAAVHVVNLGTDHTAAHEIFKVYFVSAAGTLLVPLQNCDIGAGQTCTVYLTGANCPSPGQGVRCSFRAVVVGDPLVCVTPDLGTGDWMTNLEMIEPDGASRYIAGESGVLKLPTNGCSPVDNPAPDDAGVDAPPVDAPPIDAQP